VTDAEPGDVAARITWGQALAWRMRRQHLTRRAGPTQLLPVATRICGLHAQIMSSAELSVWARIDNLDRGAVHDALWTRRELVKLWAMRGTLHLLPAAELGLWLGAFASYRHYGLTHPAILDLVTHVGNALDGTLLTRAELAAQIQRRTGSTATSDLIHESWGSYLKPVSLRGQLCFAPGDGQRVRFTHPASWVPGGVEHVDEAPALARATRAFLGAFGPAEPRDLARWWGVGPARAQRMLNALGPDAVPVDVSGDRCWILTEHLPELTTTAPTRTVRLLPAFDQWVVNASRTTPAQLAPQHRDRVYRPQGWISPALLVGGRISGTWTSRRVGRRLLIEITPFGRLTDTVRRRAEAEADRLATYLSRTPDITWQD